MGEQLYLERFFWFDNEARREQYPNATKLGEQFEISTKTAQRSIDHFRDRLLALDQAGNAADLLNALSARH